MAQTKIYPSTQAQVQAVQATVDEINAKIVTPNYQVKTVTPSNVQQTVQADNGFTALWSVTVEPIAAAMPQDLEKFIMNTVQESYSLSLSGTVPAYACYNKVYLKRVYGNIISVSDHAFSKCSSLQDVDVPNLSSIGSNAFDGCSSLQSVNAPNLTNIGGGAFSNTTSILWADFRALIDYPAWRGRIFENSAIRYLDLRSLLTIQSPLFNNCSDLTLLDFTGANTYITLSVTNSFDNTNDTWIAVVANDTVKAAFQSATNWSTYASHFRTIAEVEAEVGMTYDEYYLQCFGHPRFD